MAAKNRKILLLLDNAPSHIHSIELVYVQIEMLPPNTTSHIQPLDAGIIKNFKLQYKSKLMQHYVREVDTKGSFQRIDLKQAIYFVKDAWTMVKEQTIANCFGHTGIMPSVQATQPPEQDFQQDALSELVRVAAIGNPLALDEYLNLPEENVTEEPLTDEDIIRLVQGDSVSSEDQDNNDDDDDCSEGPPVIEPYSLAEAIPVCERLLATLESHDGFSEENYSSLRGLIRDVHRVKAKQVKQTTLTDYFKKY